MKLFLNGKASRANQGSLNKRDSGAKQGSKAYIKETFQDWLDNARKPSADNQAKKKAFLRALDEKGYIDIENGKVTEVYMDEINVRYIQLQDADVSGEFVSGKMRNKPTTLDENNNKIPADDASFDNVIIFKPGDVFDMPASDSNSKLVLITPDEPASARSRAG